MILVGQANIGKDALLNVRICYKQRGCLSSIEFTPLYDTDIAQLKGRLKQCVNDAFQYKEYKKEQFGQGVLDSTVSFHKRTERNFAIEGNTLGIKVYGYDEKDMSSMFKAQILQICNLLTFDTLRYITVGGTLTEEIRLLHNFGTRLINYKTSEVTGEMEKNKVYQGLKVSDGMAAYIDAYLERPYGYENHFSNFDKCVQLFAQGIRNEELSWISVGLPEPYAEQAIVNYMSALEVITLNDKEPVSCKCCGQMKYSIARRVADLAENTFSGLGDFVKDYYRDRSKYVYSGSLLSSNSYVNRSIPLMSIAKNSKTGMITQISRVQTELKEMVKYCIERHETDDWNENHPLYSTCR